LSQELRFKELKLWLAEQLSSSQQLPLTELSGDAGFRRYYRCHYQGNSYIVVDAPPEYINNLAFVELLNRFEKQLLTVPKLFAVDLDSGFLLLSDLGATMLADVLSTETVDSYYQQALALLPQIATLPESQGYSLPIYDREFVKTELTIFTDWLLAKHLRLELAAEEKNVIEQAFELLIVNALEQPQVTMHRDFHSRNLMLQTDGSLAIIDFQDAVRGPITYDAVSLLRDCYVRWPDKQVNHWLTCFYRLLNEQNLLTNTDYSVFERWFDLMGMQRHIKASGIFARLHHRDGKSGYLKDIPLTLSYLIDIGGKYPELIGFSNLVANRVIPALAKINPALEK
jgi:aminoglycoside/choline kinase family phosphotransferase